MTATSSNPARECQPDRAELRRKAALFREGTRRIYEGQGDKADMWFFELWHFLGDVETALDASPQPRQEYPKYSPDDPRSDTL